jgi:alanyl-tRNA synthetase
MARAVTTLLHTLPPTVRLDRFDALTFDARVVAHGNLGGRATVVLDRSAFHPESGGQMADHGRIGDTPVVDVQIDDREVVHHVLAGPPPPVGATVHGEVDRARRQVFTALHTGQHVLSRAFLEIAGAETVSSRLGETTCTLDLDRDALPERTVAEAEALANAVVDDDLPVRAWIPKPDELAALPLRRQPRRAEGVRVVAVGDFDVSPCGGTHVRSSAAIGVVRVWAVERHKGGTRVTFDAGARARRTLVDESRLLAELARDLTCGARDLRGAIARLRRDLGDERTRAGRLAHAVHDAEAERLRHAADMAGRSWIVAALDPVLPGDAAALEQARAVSGRLAERPFTLAVVGVRGTGGLLTCVARGPGSSVDCGELLRALAAASGGRGGGRPERAEGRLPSGVDLEALLAVALSPEVRGGGGDPAS